MNLNIDLREEKFLFPDDDNFGDKTYKTHNSGVMVGHLNRNGIYTVNDLINANDECFNNRNVDYFRAVIQILKYKYFGEELVFDVLFDEKYSSSSDFDLTRKKLAKDLRRLGFGRSLSDCQNYAASFLRINQSFEFITMDDCLKDTRIILDNIGSTNLRGFYLEYINKKKKSNIEIQSLPTAFVLENLKTQLIGLRTMRDGLDCQIKALENMINQYYGNTGVKKSEQGKVKIRGRKKRTNK